ncbi:spinster family MFS transporter [Parasphingorhabdus halotolerans]|uniref:MFS transporter n=1 Tax=Parasphingorhabdus halotolerans TaxID=2725558 RepID=A0A6H2DLE1_9SPHN|nr:MFS transporter [Parasphingorhabdus halotolerans]QJB69492.1 MFS transporter [Parasphingorhabdus halotolerans]
MEDAASGKPALEVTRSPAPSRQTNYALGVLFVVTMLNFLDRQIISIVAEPIKQDLGLTDTQLGLMTGLSFAIFYTTLAIPVAALADRWNRSRIIAIAIATWSAMTVACGLSANFIQLFLARVGVGIGEAGSAPASHSLIADLFPPDRRSGALGILGMSVPIGAFLAYAGGGWITENLDWRSAFLIAGLPGIIIAIVIWFTVPDPRGKIPLSAAFKAKPNEITFKDAFKELSSKPAYWHLVAAGVLVQFVSYGLASFYGGLFVRVHGIGYGELGWKLGVMVGLSGGFGAWFGGKIGDILGKGNPRLPLLLSGLMLVIAAPGMIWAIYADNVNVAIALLAFPTFGATFYYGPSFAAIQALANDRTRAMAVAIYLLVAGLIGLGIGPVFVGGLSDYFAGGDKLLEASALQKALAILALFNIWAGFHYWRAEANIKR